MNLIEIEQQLISNPLQDVTATVHSQLDSLNLCVPKGNVAITAGSRGIDQIDTITRAIGTWLRKQGATPFVVPCMGSHNGATGEGQKLMVESLGITEEAMDMEIQSSMDVVKLAAVASGDVYMDKNCFESDGVIVLNRVKLHTSLSGSVQSGLLKMMVVGMGKIKSARTFHATPTAKMTELLVDMAKVILATGKILAGVAILEDGFDKCAEIHALHPNEIIQREPALLEKNKKYFPSLPIDDLNVLVIKRMGKTYSGTGMDTNVIGYRGIKGHEDLVKPNIHAIAALTLDPKSQGNAMGVGLADFITQALRDEIDEEKTFINAFSTGDMIRMKIPATLKTEEVLIQKMRECYGDKRWMIIPNTLHLNKIYVSEDLADELPAHCKVINAAFKLTFENNNLALDL